MKQFRLLWAVAGAAVLLAAFMIYTPITTEASVLPETTHPQATTDTLHIYSTDTWSYPCSGGTVIEFVNGCAHYDYGTSGNYEILRRWFVCGPTENTTITQRSSASHYISGWGYTNLRVSIPTITDTFYSYHGTGNETGNNELSTGTVITNYFIDGGAVAWGDIGALGSSGHLTYSVDVCIGDATIPVSPTVSDYCPDGTEVISDPIYLVAGEYWASDMITTSWDYIQARYTISNANEPAGRVLAGLATLNGKDWLWGPQHNASTVSVTIPSSIGYDEDPNGPDVELGVRNTYDPFYLVSACIVPYSQTMVPSDCNLANHSFTEDLPGWATLVYDYLADEEDGAISLDSIVGLASQVVTLTGSFRMEVRARSGGISSEFRFGGYELGYPFESEEFTETATSEYQIFNGYLYLDGRSNISLVSNDDDLIVDWVCLSGHDTSGLPWKFPIPDCEFPTFDDHPEYSITEIGNWIDWLAQKTGELLKWGVCQMFVALFTIANMILEAIRAIGGFVGSPDWPTLPDEITFDSILEWLRQVYVAFFNWLGLNFTRFRDAIPMIVGWWWNVVLGVIGWIIDSLIAPIFGWLLDQLLAALGVGDDTRAAFMILWRDWRIFLEAAWIEAGYEFDSLILLLQETTGVFGILIVGLRGVATGDTELDFGEALGGLAGYLWRGVAFINEVVSFTPLSALNIVALGIITIGLAQWTVKKFVGMLERFS